MLELQILGVNEVGHEGGNAAMVAGRTLPLLQDEDQDVNGQSDVWNDLWEVQWRDVVVVNADNEKVGVYNLTTNDLSASENYQTLRSLILTTAIRDQRPWSNPDDLLDVDDDGSVTVQDATQVIQTLNTEGSRLLADVPDGEEPPAFYDTNLNGYVTPLDLLLVINALNESSSVASLAAESASLAAMAPQDGATHAAAGAELSGVASPGWTAPNAGVPDDLSAAKRENAPLLNSRDEAASDPVTAQPRAASVLISTPHVGAAPLEPRAVDALFLVAGSVDPELTSGWSNLELAAHDQPF